MSDTSVCEPADQAVQQPAAQERESTREEAFRALIAWAQERHAEGYCPAQIYNLIREGTWSAEDALDALLRVLPESLHEQARMLARGAPNPDFKGSPSTVVIDGHPVQILCDMGNPRLVVFGNLLSPQECSALIECAESRLTRSCVTDDGTGSQVSDIRTSSGMFFGRGETALHARIEARIAALLDWPACHSEDLQVLRYGQNQEYVPHHDNFEAKDGPWAPVYRRGGERVGSMIIYLNTPARGGSSVFPDIPMEIRAVQGHAVFFAYETPDASSRTLHGGAPVIDGEKWVAVKWFRQGQFD